MLTHRQFNRVPTPPPAVRPTAMFVVLALGVIVWAFALIGIAEVVGG